MTTEILKEECDKSSSPKKATPPLDRQYTNSIVFFRGENPVLLDDVLVKPGEFERPRASTAEKGNDEEIENGRERLQSVQL